MINTRELASSRTLVYTMIFIRWHFVIQCLVVSSCSTHLSCNNDEFVARYRILLVNAVTTTTTIVTKSTNSISNRCLSCVWMVHRFYSAIDLHHVFIYVIIVLRHDINNKISAWTEIEWSTNMNHWRHLQSHTRLTRNRTCRQRVDISCFNNTSIVELFSRLEHKHCSTIIHVNIWRVTWPLSLSEWIYTRAHRCRFRLSVNRWTHVRIRNDWFIVGFSMSKRFW
jgi:hypothetical protein